MSRIAAMTMVRGDAFFLSKWVDYYGRQLGRENLFIYFDGLDQEIPPFCAGTHAQCVEKIGAHVVSAEKGRLAFLSDRAAERFAQDGYDLVIGTDADEYVVVDPRLGLSLPEYLERAGVSSSLSPLGLDVGQKMGVETDLSLSSPFLSQRRYARVCTRYTKPSILAAPLRWGSGFHRVKGHNFHIAKNLYLLHFGYADMAQLQARFADADRAAQGWGPHLRKRAGTIALVSSRKGRSFGTWIRLARLVQTCCRPPYAWNKPAMLGARLVVEIPRRFEKLL